MLSQEQKRTNRRHDWTAIKAEYVQGNDSLRDLAAKHAMDIGEVGRHAAAESWVGKRAQFRAELSARIEEQVKHALSTQISHDRLQEILSPRRSNRIVSNANLERNKLTPKLRYTILARDGFKCLICGRSPENDGIVLHVDHIYPISKGGKTIPENLQTTCRDCNVGKSNSIEGGLA